MGVAVGVVDGVGVLDSDLNGVVDGVGVLVGESSIHGPQ